MNPFYWDEYSEDTIKYMMEIEGRYDRFKYSFELSSSPKDDRLKFVQMIICLGYEAYRMESTTVHIAVNILDRFFITQMSEKVGHQECLAACLASLVIAIKLEEGRKLSTNDLCHQVLYACSAHEVSQMELHILCALKFEIIVATTAGFCEFFKRGIVQDQNTLDVIDFLCDLSLYSYELLSHNPSQIAACVIWIGLCSSNRDWDEDMAILTGYSRYDLTPCSEIFQELVCHTFRAIKQKPLLQVYPRMSEIMACLKQIMQA
ncbi:hypothetical protein BGW38_006025 [Lunasporangiospora selenospora]|uniref:Cyclin N-terminal domain-containing protein n=1 Tax=Lunasporangiospora selenospora TaxID=979761 RepID=A0A9P6FP76_9FUNG|nr:hypothetical protein BGW38_006025 [Lunasporangiospora selenospora]